MVLAFVQKGRINLIRRLIHEPLLMKDIENPLPFVTR
jgi:hypothetical protein